MGVAKLETDTLEEFFQYIYGAESGFIYLAVKVPGNQHAFQQHFFSWPEERQAVYEFVLAQRQEREVYYAPALFTQKSALKEHVKSASVVWCEFDGREPTDLGNVPGPTLRIQSSEEGHSHWYWRLDQSLQADDLERINRSLAYLLGADASGWDACQILRPPCTLNHKRQRPVHILERHDVALPPALFDGLPEPPPPVEAPVPERIPPIEHVVFKYQWPPSANQLFRAKEIPVGKRSSALMSLGFYCAEMNMETEEMLAVLMNADQRWGKFYGRTDRMKRLMEIVVRARQKYPYRPAGQSQVKNKLEPMGFLTLLRTQVQLEWLWEGLLHKQGYMLLTGPSAIGKTSLSLDIGSKIVLGLEALGRKTTACKIGFFSLEMGLVELKSFLLTLASGYSQDQQEVLEEQFLFFPLGEPIYLNRREEKERVQQAIRDYELDGVIIDSLGSTTSESLSDEKEIRNIMDWNDQLRQRMGIFSWFIHHHRKASDSNKRPNKLSDVFGSGYITNRATSVICLWEAPVANTIEVIPLKVRLTEKPTRFSIRRGSDLHFIVAPGMAPTEKITPEARKAAAVAAESKTEEDMAIESYEAALPRKDQDVAFDI